MKDFRITSRSDRVAVLASGGLDSSIMLAELARAKRHVFPLYIQAGLRWEGEELGALRRFVCRLGLSSIEPIAILTLPMSDIAAGHWSVSGKRVPGYRAAISSNYIAGRNLALLTKASIFCARNRIGEIALASLRVNPFPDARPEFFRAFERTVELGMEFELRILTPFAGLGKAAVIRRGRELPLALTLSCAKPRGLVHCGACTKCAERVRGFRDAGVPDPTRYAN